MGLSLSLAPLAARLAPLVERAAPSRPALVGWLLDTDKAGFIWEAPRRLRTSAECPRHAKSVTACPAVVDHEARHFVVPCPISARLRIAIDPKTGEANLANADGDRASVRTRALGEMVKRVNAREWRHPRRPIIQFVTPYVFVSDDPVHMSQFPPFAHRRDPEWPGLVIGGRFPIDVWPRHLMWAFEWHDLDRELVLTRGEPWFYVGFETPDPRRHVRLVEAERTADLVRYLEGTRAVASYVGGTFSLFTTARSRRPRRLLTPRV